jgi:hypothetical protein
MDESRNGEAGTKELKQRSQMTKKKYTKKREQRICNKKQVQEA